MSTNSSSKGSVTATPAAISNVTPSNVTKNNGPVVVGGDDIFIPPEPEEEEEEDDDEEDDDDDDDDVGGFAALSGGTSGATSSSAAAAAAAADNNKWSKNGYGEGVTKHGGKFTKEESEEVRKAVEEYCAMKQISPARLCAECDHKTELKGAWMEIAKKLPHRSVQSVYRHGLRTLHPYKRGPWTEEECQMLLDLVHRLGKKWAAIQSRINRSADSCRDKYREMSDTYVKGRWKEGETEILKRLIREHLGADMNADIRDLGKMVEQEGITIPWSAISKRMGRRSRLSCFKKWQKLTGIYSLSDKGKALPKNDAAAAAGAAAAGMIKQQEEMVAGFIAAQPPPQGPSATATTTAATKPMDSMETTVPTADTTATANTTTITTAATATMPATTTLPTADSMPMLAMIGAPQLVTQHDYDVYLLSVLANSGVTRSDDVSWEGLPMEHAHERWLELVQELQAEGTSFHEDLVGLPLAAIAQYMLDRKTSAKMAAETVEAVDLPTPETLHSREL